ncbi:MAG: hypothetical protein KC777_25310 [Cyanobacteria bacterium HKST-UBA02]|nr:hypothetical protein [Cyanobacteria bacterium HKST-UBA02]
MTSPDPIRHLTVERLDDRTFRFHFGVPLFARVGTEELELTRTGCLALGAASITESVSRVTLQQSALTVEVDSVSAWTTQLDRIRSALSRSRPVSEEGVSPLLGEIMAHFIYRNR